jgi:CHAP domain
MRRRYSFSKLVAAAALAMTLAACATSSGGGRFTPAPFRPLPADQYGEAITGPPRIVEAPPMECVPFARLRSGINLWGDAYLWWQAASEAGYTERNTPAMGDILALRVGTEGNRGHLAYVKRVVGPREIFVDHANWHGRQEVAVDVPVIDVSPNNDWSEVQVFWVDSGQMGARTYTADGFIAPHTPGA